MVVWIWVDLIYSNLIGTWRGVSNVFKRGFVVHCPTVLLFQYFDIELYCTMFYYVICFIIFLCYTMFVLCCPALSCVVLCYTDNTVHKACIFFIDQSSFLASLPPEDFVIQHLTSPWPHLFEIFYLLFRLLETFLTSFLVWKRKVG